MAFDWGTSAPATPTPKPAATGGGPFSWGTSGAPATAPAPVSTSTPAVATSTPAISTPQTDTSTTTPAIAPATPANTTSLLQKFLGFVSKVTTPPDQDGGQASKNAQGQSAPIKSPSTLDYLPSELARAIPGVAQLQDATPDSPAVAPAIDSFISSRGEKLKSQRADIDAQRAKLNTSDKKQVAAFNASIDTYNKGIDTYQKDLDAYNNATGEDAQKPVANGFAKINAADLLAEMPGAIFDTAKGFAQAGVTELANVWDVGRSLFNKNPNASFDVPGLGKITSVQMNAAEQIANGADPISTVLSAAGNAIFDTLFFVDVMGRVAGPRGVKVAETNGNFNDFTKPTENGPRPVIDSQPKTGRLYEKPTAYNRGGAQVLPKEMIDQMEGQGIKLGSRFDPTQPVFFKVTAGKGGAFKGEIIQLKPSYLQTAYSKLFGSTMAESTLPALLGADTAPVPKGINPADLGPIADTAKPEDAVIIHSQTVHKADIVPAVNDALVKAKESEVVSQPHKPAPEAPKVTPTTHVVAHNAIRLLGGDTSKAQAAGDILNTEIKAAVDQHGPHATSLALQDKLGVDARTADKMVSEASRPQTPEEVQKASADILAKVAPPKPKEVLLKDHVQTYGIQQTIRDGAAMYGLPSEGFANAWASENQKTHAEISALAIASPDIQIRRDARAFLRILSDKVGDENKIPYLQKLLEAVKGKGTESEIIAKAITEALPKKAEGPILHHGTSPEVAKSIRENGFSIVNGDRSNGAILGKGVYLDKTGGEGAKLYGTEVVPSEVKPGLNMWKGNVHDLYTKETNFGDPTLITEKLEKEGYDGVEMDNQMVVFNPKNIRVSPRGFINMEKVAEDITEKAKEVKAFIDKTQKTTELTGTLSDAIYQHEGARKANRQRAIQLLQSRGADLTSEQWEKLYHYDENKDEQLTPEEKEMYDNVIVPLKTALTKGRAEYRELGGVITPDLREEMTPRYAKEKGGPIDKIIEGAKDLKNKAKQAISNGGLLSKSVGSGAKHRVFHIATDEAGNRTVVSIKDGKVTAFKDGTPSHLGEAKGFVTPKMKEFFDPDVRLKLESLAKSLGITHERVPTGKSLGLGGGRAGVSFQGENLVKTRMSQDSVLAHEIGHQIDHKYGMQAVMNEERIDAKEKSQFNKELRDLADTRFAGKQTTPNFQKYVRKGTEKMAVMFEAYISNKDMFRAVAPHVYDDFRDFLASHAELRPFLDIQGSTKLGSEVHGGEQSGLVGKTLVGMDGKTYKIGQATTKEIESNTNTRYHKNVLANYVLAYDRTLNALSAMKLLERIKNSPEFGEVVMKDDGENDIPLDWKSVSDKLPQFRGYYFDPKTAEALMDLASRQTGKEYFPIFDEVNNLLTAAIVINPIMHFPNVVAGWGAAESGTGRVPFMADASKKNLALAINEVRNKGPLYLSYLEHGAPFMAVKGTAKDFTDAVLTQYTESIANDPQEEHTALANALGYANPLAMMRGLSHLNESITWGGNDIMFMHALLDYQNLHGGTMEDGIEAVSKAMADYRLPSRIGPGKMGRAVSLMLQSRGFMFARYHYSGVIKPWIENLKDSASRDASAKERLAGLRTLAYLALMGFLVYPFIDKMLRGITGSDLTYVTMAGPVKVIQNAEKLSQTGVAGVPAAIQSIMTPSPAITAVAELGWNVDMFTRNPIYGFPPAEGLPQFGLSMVAPLSGASRMAPADFALSLFGVYTPNSTPAKNALNAQKYDEKPALEVQVKKDIVSGNMKKAQAEMADFNQRAIANWNQYQLSIGGKPLAADGSQTEAFLKEWGIAMPGEKALANANALYGAGALTSKQSLIDTVANYAKAIGVDPVAAFSDIFKGQRIVRVYNAGLFNPDSTIIVERMPLDQSTAIRNKDAQAQGLNDDQMKGMQLDHVIPLEAGGTNEADNLNLTTTAQDGGDQQALEDFLGKAAIAGAVSRAKVREYAIRFKAGQGEQLSNSYMQEYKNKYGSQPISLQEIESEINNGKAK